MRRGAVVGLVLLALALRLPGLWTDFWLDEIWALDNVGRVHSAVGIFTSIHHDSNHWLISLWMYVVGQHASFWVYRVPSLLAGLATVLAAGALARRDRSSPLIAMTLVAVSFPLGFYASEARGYAFAACAALVSQLCLLEWLDSVRVRWLVAYWVVAAVGLLAHLSFVAVLAAAGVFAIVLVARGRVPATRAFVPLAGPALVLAGLAVVDLRYLEFGGGPSLVRTRLAAEVGALAVGAPINLSWTPLFAVVSGAAVAAAVWRIASTGRERQGSGVEALLWVFYGAVTVLPLVTALAVRPPFLFPRYFLVSLAFVPVLLAAAGARLNRRAAVLLVVAIVAVNAWSWVGFWRVGRGHYAEALAGLLEETPEGPVTITSDHDFRNEEIINFYRTRLGPDGARLSYVPHGEPARYVIVSLGDERGVPDDCTGCELVADYPSSPLSGAEWKVYRRLPLTRLRSE